MPRLPAATNPGTGSTRRAKTVDRGLGGREPLAALGAHLVGHDDGVVDEQPDGDDHAEDAHLVKPLCRSFYSASGAPGTDEVRGSVA